MLLPLSNVPRDYAWGSTTAIPELLGLPVTGKPQAELWLGAHHGSPATIHDGVEVPLDQWIANDPHRALSGATRLPFLMKVLAAAAPLSLQVHPSRAQAQAGFARENAAGLSIDSPIRNYKDGEHKPELIVALSEEFVALCGFRPFAACIHDLQELVNVMGINAAAGDFVDELRERAGASVTAAYAWAVEHLLRGAEESRRIVAEFTAAAETERAQLAAPIMSSTIHTLAKAYPGDPGVVIAALLNRVVLDRGEALYLPAGNVHAYMGGVGIELMSSSDNVLRGGLTPKHVDVDELIRVADFEPLSEPRLTPVVVSKNLRRFDVPVDDFQLFQFDSRDASVTAEMNITVAAVALCTEGSLLLSAGDHHIELTRGQACFITGEETSVKTTGQGELFLATSRG